MFWRLLEIHHGPRRTSSKLRLELPLLADAGHHEAAVLVLLDVAGVEELLEQVGSGVAILPLLLHLVEPLLEAVIVCQLGCDLLLLEELRLLVGCDLRLGAAPLGANLEEVGGNALARCRRKGWVRRD